MTIEPNMDGVVLRLRISDNVLDEKDWSVHEITFGSGNVITKVKELKSGAYGFIDDPKPDIYPSVGWTRARLKKWLEYDSTGSHPENYHECWQELGRYNSAADNNGEGWDSGLPEKYWSEAEQKARDEWNEDR